MSSRTLPVPADRADTAALVVVLASTFTVSLGYGIALPLLPYFLTRLLPQASNAAASWHIGMLAGAYMFAVFLFAPLWGYLSDRIGRRRVMLLGLAGYALTLLLFGLSRSLWFAYLMRALAGAYVAAVVPIASAFVSETAVDDKRARRLAWMGATSLTGFLVGPAVSSWISEMSKAMTVAGIPSDRMISLPLYAAAVLCAAVWMGIYVRLPETVPADHRDLHARGSGILGSRPQLFRLLALSLLVTFGLGSFEVGMVLQARQTLGWEGSKLASMFAVCSLVMIAVQVVLFAPTFKALPGHRLLVPVFLALGVGFTLVPGAVSFSTMLLVVGLIAASSGMVMPALTHMVSVQTVLPLGVALGLQTALSSLGQGLGSAAVGIFYGPLGDRFFWVSAALMVVGAIIATGIAGSNLPVAAHQDSD
jgi:DHA1 family multidrug resistance protein-like MFS transporter